MNRMKYAALVAVGSLGLSGCATIMHGANQTLQLDSEPHGAAVKLSSGATCVTPCKIDLPRRHDLAHAERNWTEWVTKQTLAELLCRLGESRAD